jgi:hypothetical protein
VFFTVINNRPRRLLIINDRYHVLFDLLILKCTHGVPIRTQLPPTSPLDPVAEVDVSSAAVGEGGLNWKVSVAKNPVVCGRLGVLVEGPEVDGFAGDVGHCVVLVSGAGAASA